MLDKERISTLLGLGVDENAPVILVYSEHPTERLNYTCGFIFNHVLKLKYSVTSDMTAFTSSEAFRINYSKKEISGVFRLTPGVLLEERGASEVRPFPVFRNDMLYFYNTPENKDFPYDIFSATFYMISRYEEWQPFHTDKYDRFESASSILVKNKFNMKPVVDVWIQELGIALQKFYPKLVLPAREFRVISTIDVDNLYAYQAKGLFRTAGAIIKDLLKFKFRSFGERLQVLTGKKKDPFDIYDSVSDFCREKDIPLVYFFLFRSGTRRDRTVNPESPAYLKVFKTIKDRAAFLALHPSYDSSVKKAFLKEEVEKFSAKSNAQVVASRQHFLRFDMHTTPALLVENGIEADFTMGFASAPGFRAGTSHPFYYYNFRQEQISSLLFVPFCVMDGVYTVYNRLSADVAYEDMLKLATEIKSVNGIFMSVFHERSFSDHLYNGYGTLYKKLHSKLKEL